MRYLFLALLAIFFAVHLYHSWTDERKKRAITKPFLLPMIILYYVFSVSEINWILIIALVTSWIGDILLIPKGTKWFTAGGISFLVSHITFIMVYAKNIDFSKVGLYLVIPVAVIYVTVAAIIFKILLPHNSNKPLFAAMAVYILANATMNIFAFMQMITLQIPGAIIAYIGAFLFFCSDCSLFVVDFHPKRDMIFKRHFTVMLTYVLGEFLITQGILMIG